MDSNLCLSDMKKVLDREGVPVHMGTRVASFDEYLPMRTTVNL